MKLKYLLLIFGIVVFFGGISYLSSYLSSQEEKKVAEQKERENQEYLLIEKSNKKYIKEIKALCSGQLLDISGIDFFRCKNSLDENSYYYDLQKELASPNLPTFCNRKLKELKTDEFVECLQEPEEN